MEQIDTIGEWSKNKLGLLRKYLEAYLVILTKQKWCESYEYIDAFAGTGKPQSRDEEIFVDGSPRVALSLKKPFTHYHFIEESSWRVKKLEELREEFTERKISIYQGDCNKILIEKVVPQLPYASKKRAIAFIDPFGMQLNWETLKTIASTKTIEIMLNFPVMAINRGVLKRNPKAISEKERKRLDLFWGIKDWMFDLYEEDHTLFGVEQKKREMSGKEMGRVFKKRLSEIFQHCTDPILMVNSNNAPLYCLMFAGHKASGAKIASDIFKKFEQTRQL